MVLLSIVKDKIMPLFLIFMILFTSLNAVDSLDKAKQYFKDQEQEKGFKAFLDLLENVSMPAQQAEVSKTEQHYYDQALNRYLDHSQIDIKANSLSILTQFGLEFSNHPEYLQLAYIIAAAEANLGNFQTFFDHFYAAYKNNPKHFIAYKTKAILHIKLLERARTEPERQVQLQKILDNINLAIERYPHDTSLYKIRVSFADGVQKSRIISDSLNKIIKDNIIVPRVDIAFYIQHAVDNKQYDLAQAFIDKACCWYPVSRFLTASQNYLNEHKPK